MWLIPRCFGSAAETGRYARKRLRGCLTLSILTLFFVRFGPNAGANAQAVPAAQELYDRGVADFQAGRYELACQELRDSYRLEALPGVLFTLATCEARAGRVASSAAHFQDFLQLVSMLPPEQRAREREREQVAMSERRALLPSVPSLVVSVTGGLPAGAEVQCDGALLGPSSLGKALPLDPGVHVLSLTMSDGSRSERQIELGRGTHQRVLLVPPLGAAAHLDKPAEPRPVPAANARRPLMISSGVVAGVGLVAGGILGGLAFRERGVVDDHCAGTACDRRGEQAASRGKWLAHGSSAGAALAVAGLASMLIVHLTLKPVNARAEQRARLTITPRGVVFGATF